MAESVDLDEVAHYEPSHQGLHCLQIQLFLSLMPACVVQSVGHLTHKSEVLGSIPGLATYFRFSFCGFKKGSCQLPAKICARSSG